MTTTRRLYAVTGLDGRSWHGGSGTWRLGRWRSVSGPLGSSNGLRLCTLDQLPRHLGPAIWEAEVDGEVLDAGSQIVARRARIVRRVETWDERTARLWAADCAEHVLHLFEREHPDDDRPRRAIEVARRHARGEATDAELAAAAAAAWASMAAAWAAADAAAAAAAWAAAAAAAAAAWAAAWAVRAADAAAADATAGAARAAAASAARAAEERWQADRLAELLGEPR